MPYLAAAERVERVRFVHGSDVHHAVDDERRHFERARGAWNRKNPLGRQALDVTGVDLVQRAEAVAAHVAVVGRPGAGLGMRHIGEVDSGSQFTRGKATRIGAQAAEVSDQVAYLNRARIDLRHDRFFASHLGNLVLQEQVQLAVDGKHLQVERAFVLRDAANSLAVSQPYIHGPVGRDAARAATWRDSRRSPRVAKRLLDLSRRPTAPDVRKIRADRGAASLDHVATLALALGGEEALTGRAVTRRHAAIRDARRLLQPHHVSGNRAGFLTRNLERRHASTGNALEDQVADRFQRCSPRGPDVHDAGTVSTAASVFAVTAGAARLVLPLPSFDRLGSGVVHDERNRKHEREDSDHLST